MAQKKQCCSFKQWHSVRQCAKPLTADEIKTGLDRPKACVPNGDRNPRQQAKPGRRESFGRREVAGRADEVKVQSKVHRQLHAGLHLPQTGRRGASATSFSCHSRNIITFGWFLKDLLLNLCFLLMKLFFRGWFNTTSCKLPMKKLLPREWYIFWNLLSHAYLPFNPKKWRRTFTLKTLTIILYDE